MFYSLKTTLLLLGAIAISIQVERAFALEPLESLLLGNFSESYSENKTDPLNYVFNRDKSMKSADKGDKRELALYRGFYEEGKNTLNYCKEQHDIRYATEWEKIQVMRSFLSEIQYIGLDLLSRAIPQYAKSLDFTKEEYGNLVDGLVGNFCSANLSVISKKELKNNFLVKFDHENTFKLPTVAGNKYFPENLDTYLPPKIALEQEFKYSVKLFQSICSWGGDPTNPVLMAPILKNPALMSFFIRQMNNQTIDWVEKENSLFLKEDKNTVQVWCDNLICRKTFRENFYNKVSYSVGGTNLSEDLKRLYCEEFRTIDYKSQKDERLKKIINSRTFDEENFINGQFIALITGIPDFLLRAYKFSQGEDLFRSSVDDTWNKWAKSQIDVLNRELYFEEPLTLELIQSKKEATIDDSKFKVSFDVNLGEFDRINQKNGKISLSFKINVQRSFLIYYRETLKELDPRNTKEKEYLLNRLKMQMTKDLKDARDKFIIPPWKGDLESLIANEIGQQLLAISDRRFKMQSTGFETIIIELNYGLFALKYINHQKTVQNGQEKTTKLLSQ